MNLDDTKGTQNLVLMLMAGILATLFFDFAVFEYRRHVLENHFAIRASVLDIQYDGPQDRSAYAKLLIVRVVAEVDQKSVQRVIKDGWSSGRPAFAQATRVGDRIVVWVDRRDGSFSLFEPTHPKLFSTVWIASWTIGLVACLLTGLLVGEAVPQRASPIRRGMQ